MCLTWIHLHPNFYFPPIHHPSSGLRLLLYAAGGATGLPAVWERAEVHLPDNLSKKLVHHGLALGRSLHEGAAPVLSKRLALTGGHFPLLLQVHLVTNQHHRHLLVPLDKREEVKSLQCTSEIHCLCLLLGVFCYRLRLKEQPDT